MSEHAAYSIGEIRRSAVHFLMGKVGSAVLSVLIFVLLAHSLRLDGYGAYATLLAIVELGFALSNLGLDWATARYLPEYRMYARSDQMRAFLRLVSLPRLLALLVLAGVLLLMQNAIASWLNMEKYIFALNVYCGVLVIEGLGRTVRDSILGELMQQKLAQISLVLRNLMLLLGILWLKVTVWPEADADHIRLHDVVIVEAIAALLGFGLALYFLYRYLRTLPPEPITQHAWQPVSPRVFWRTAIHMYVSYLLTLAYGAQVLTFVVNTWLGLQAAAVFGFARNLSDLLRKYLPSEMFMSLIRPKLVATYSASGGDVAALRSNALLVWKVSLFVLTPGMLFFAAYGREFVHLVSDGKFTEYYLIVFGMMLALIPASQRRILEMVATILHHPDLCSRASAAGLVMLPLAFLLLSMDMGLWAIVITLILGETLFNTVLIVSLKRRGYPYVVPVRSLVVLGGTGVLSWLLLYLAGLHPANWWTLGLVLLLSTLLFLFIAYLFKPFTADERNNLNQLAKRPVFVW